MKNSQKGRKPPSVGFWCPTNFWRYPSPSLQHTSCMKILKKIDHISLHWTSKLFKELEIITRKKCSRGVLIDTLCLWCLKEEETTTHALLVCENVQRIWFVSNIGICTNFTIVNVATWIGDVLSQRD